VAIILVWLGGWFFTALVIVAGLIMNWEWDRLCGGTGRGAHLWLRGGAIVGAMTSFQLGHPLWALAIAVIGGLAASVAPSFGRAGWRVLGASYIIAPCIALIWLRGEPATGLATVIWLLAVVWASDTGAYFFGRAIGGPKMAPKISPNKTWAGLIGGAGSAAIVGIAAGYLTGAQSFVYLVVSGAILALVGQLGDVFESSIKRRFKVKDSGSIIPGHGGLFDRLDSLLFVAVIYAAMMLMTGGVSVWR
jgi:phosphatidate cytidylyltransferase